MWLWMGVFEWGLQTQKLILGFHKSMKFFNQMSDCQLLAKTSPLHSYSANKISKKF